MTESTCWTMIHAATNGQAPARDVFARRYLEPVRAYLTARWRGSPLLTNLDDAVQEVFFDLFRQGGALDRVDREHGSRFRSFLRGVAKTTARSVERRNKYLPMTGNVELAHVTCKESTPSIIFDRTWATSIVHEAAQRQIERAESLGDEALRRVELLKMRFQQDFPIRDIARQWDIEPEILHREYAKAREEFRAALFEVVASHHPGSRVEIEQECSHLISLLN